MSARRSCTSSRIENMSSARFASDSARQAGKAAFPLATARSISSTEANATSPVCRPVAGLKTGPVRPDVPATFAPSIQWPIEVTGALSVSVRSGNVVLMGLPPSRGRFDGPRIARSHGPR